MSETLRATADVEGTPVRWVRDLTVEYQPAGPDWRPATGDETCIAGAGGRGAWKSKACGRPAVVAQVHVRDYAGREPRTYSRAFCEQHAGGRLVLDGQPDQQVVEPVENPLGGGR